MMPEETIQAILSQVRIADVVGEFVALKQRGDVLLGHCPFHTEPDPTLVVQPEKGLFFCHGCHRGGDAVEFLRQQEHCSEEEALRWLAGRYGVELPAGAAGDELYRVSEQAQRWFADYLYNDEMGRAVGLSYLHGRGLSDDIIRRFGLGYCADEWTALTDRALQQGFSQEALVQTGLAIRRDDGRLYDRFKGRVAFPLFSVSGRVVGFSCRILRNDDKAAKYVNSPESPIYDKGATLYGLFQAREAIKQEDKCYLVEGNVDVVSMHQCGVTNTVASCGTALTPKQVRLLKQHTQNVTMVYDGDAAGVKATLRAAELLFEQGMQVRMVLFPDNDDPDSYARKHGDEALRDFLRENETTYIDYAYRVLPQRTLNDPIRKAETLREMVKTIASVRDPNERNEYLRLFASRFQTNERTLQQEVAKRLADNAKKTFEAQQQPAPEFSPVPPDDLFLPEEYGAPQPSGPNAQPPAPPAPDEAQERKIISLLLNSGSELIPVPHQEGEPDQDYVATVIVSDILTSDLSFDNPIYHTIFHEFVDAIKHGELPSADYFTRYPNAQLRSTAIEMLVDALHVSPKWAEKHVAVQRPEEHLGADVESALLIFKLRKIDHSRDALDRQLRQNRDPEQLLALVAQKNQLLKSRQAICDRLNCIYN